MEVNEGHLINVTFLDFDIEYWNWTDYDCRYDFVKIIDENGVTLMDKTCGNQIPASLITSSNRATLWFKTDADTNKKGFRLIWAEVESKSISQINQVKNLTSPKYPEMYDNLLNLEMVMEVQPGSSMEIIFLYFEVEKGEVACEYDSISIIDGNGTELLAKTCGNSLPEAITSFTNRAVLKFITDLSERRKGFFLQYKAVEQKVEVYNITSPNYPDNYPDNLNEEYEMEVPIGKKIEMKFMDFSVEYDYICQWDDVGIIDGNQQIILAPTCGNSSLPDPLYSITNKATLKFKTDGSVTDRGFFLQYKEVDSA